MKMATGWRCAVLLTLAASPSLAAETAPAITSGPTVTRDGDALRIAFTVSADDDVEVAILDAKGAVVRHLAAGLLGPKAPAPFAKGALAQEVVWDGADDRGNPVRGAVVRVRVGLRPRLDRYIGWDGLTVDQNIVGLAVDDRGDIYVLSTENSWGRSLLTVISRDGHYKRTVIPFSSKTPKSRRAPFGTHTMPDGTEAPFVFNGHNGNTQFMISALRDQDVVVHPAGHLVLTSANGSLSNHGPAQHLIAVHPEGGVPEGVPYVGPRVRKAIGFIGGAGNRDANVFNGLAVSPDGAFFYEARFTSQYKYKKTRPHGVFRLRWADKTAETPFLGKQEAGADDGHFNNPMGLATDSNGNIYVCDYGNNRLMIFSPEAKLLRKIEVPTPYQVKVHPKTGAIYVLSRRTAKPIKVKASAIIKYAPLADGAAKQAEQKSAGRCFKTIAIDPTADPARLVVAVYGGWWTHDRLVTLTDKGDAFEVGRQLNNRKGLSYPLFASVDTVNGKFYVNSFMTGCDSVDLATGAVERMKLNLKNSRIEVVARSNGQVYAASGWAWALSRYDAAGRQVPLKEGNKKGFIGPWVMAKRGNKKLLARMKGRGQGGRGFAFGPDGNLYLLKMSQYESGWVDVYSPEGKLLKERLIDNVPHGCGGIGVDAAGNIYIGGNLRPLTGTDFYAAEFPAAPTDKWVWYRGKRPAPWNHLYFNTYLFHYGGIMKFPPTGGRFYIWRPKGRKATPEPADMPDGLPTYRSGYLNLNIAVQGMAWYVSGCSPVPTAGENWGDPSCTCWNPRIAADPYGRVYAPHTLRFSVGILDTAGNVITRIGRYGNADDRAGPAVHFAWPAFVAVAGDSLYVTDSNANRVAVVALDYAAEARQPIPAAGG